MSHGQPPPQPRFTLKPKKTSSKKLTRCQDCGKKYPR